LTEPLALDPAEEREQRDLDVGRALARAPAWTIAWTRVATSATGRDAPRADRSRRAPGRRGIDREPAQRCIQARPAITEALLRELADPRQLVRAIDRVVRDVEARLEDTDEPAASPS